MASPNDASESLESDKPSTSRLTGGIFLTAIAGFSILSGFGMTIAMAKKKDPNMFTRGMIPSREIPDSGGSLALRALGWGTLWSVSGVGLFCTLVWKATGAHNMIEFREAIQNIMPKIPKKEPQGRSEFKDFRDLFEYISQEDDKSEEYKKS